MGGRKGPEKRKFLVKRANPAAQRQQASKESTLEAGGDASLEKTVALEDSAAQDRMETYSHHSEPQPVRDQYGRNQHMVVARPVVEAWQDPEGKGTFGEELQTVVHPENLVVGHQEGARRGADGQVLAYTILGAPSDYDERAPPPSVHDDGEEQMFTGPPPDEDDDYGSEFGSSMSKSPSQSMRSRGAGSRRGSVSSAKSGKSYRSAKSARSRAGSQKGSAKGSQAAKSAAAEEEKSYYERSAEERQERALARYAMYENQRARLYEHYMQGRKGNLTTTTPVMFTGDEFRERREEYDLIDKAQPREEKFADSLWFMSLRDSWCRYIPLGSIFSGLFCKVREKDLSEKAFTIVRNPRANGLVNTRIQQGVDRDGKPYQYHTKNSADSIPAKSWVNDDHLWGVERHLKKSIKELLPFRADTEGLHVIGEDIWHGDRAQADSPMDAENAEGMEEGDKAWGGKSNHSHVTGSKAGLENQKAGPQVSFLEHHLAFETGPDKVASQKLPVVNTGTCAIYYKWHKADATNALGVPLRGINPVGGGFYAVEEEGVLLPGNTVEFSFAFKSKLCGIYTSTFSMTTTPPVPNSPEDLTITMRGVVTEPEEHAVKRSLLEEHLEHNSVVHEIQNILMEAIRNVELPPPAAGAEDQPQDQSKIDAKVFAKANTETLVKGDVPCLKTQSVYYEKQILSDMRDLAATAVKLPQLADLPEPAAYVDPDEAFIKSLTPRDAVYDPSLEKKAKDENEESWEEEWSWSHNVLDLGMRQLGIVSEAARTEELGKLDELVEQAVWHAHRPNPLYPPALDALSELAENIESSAAQTRRRMGLPAKDFVDPEDPEYAAKTAPPEEEVDPELEADFHDSLYMKVRSLLCEAVDQFADLAAVVVVDEAERRGEDVEED